MDEETHLRLLRLIQARPEISQRELAAELGVSLGKVNYCLKALIQRGWVKVHNFRNSDNKWAYVYLLTPSGIEQKLRLTAVFLKRKLAEHEALTREIERLRAEMRSARPETAPGNET
jgi:EPS-associated MarR family transcriptional regulator